MIDLIDQRRQTITAARVGTPGRNDDDAIYRFSTPGKPSYETGWSMLHADGIAAGASSSWRDGLTQKWCSETNTFTTEAERFARRKRIKTMQRQRGDDQRRQQSAVASALKRQMAATPCTQHYCLSSNAIQAHSVKIEGDEL